MLKNKPSVRNQIVDKQNSSEWNFAKNDVFFKVQIYKDKAEKPNKRMFSRLLAFPFWIVERAREIAEQNRRNLERMSGGGTLF